MINVARTPRSYNQPFAPQSGRLNVEDICLTV